MERKRNSPNIKMIVLIFIYLTSHFIPSFGEVFLEERNNRWNTPFLFNAKELDEETGLYYYGARYYDPRTSVWLSADPLQEKYPGVSTYAYCVNNPVKFIDPDGNSPISIVVKFAAKKGAKAVAKSLVKHIVTDRLKAYGSKKWAKQLLSDALDGVDMAMGQAWWEYAIEFVPAAGDAYGAYKLTDGGIKVAKFLERFEQRVNALSTALQGVAGGKLRKALGLAVGDGMQAHHLIPVELLQKNSVVQDAVAAGFNFNGIENGLSVLGNHGPHKGYSETLGSMIDAWAKKHPNYTPKEAKSYIESVAKMAKDAIQGNGGVVRDTLK